MLNQFGKLISLEELSLSEHCLRSKNCFLSELFAIRDEFHFSNVLYNENNGTALFITCPIKTCNFNTRISSSLFCYFSFVHIRAFDFNNELYIITNFA